MRLYSNSSPSPVKTSAAQHAALTARTRFEVLDRNQRVRPRLGRTYRRAEKRGRPHVSGDALLESLQWLNARSGAAWSEKDAEVMTEVKARAWQANELERQAVHHTPTWLRAMLPGRSSTGVVMFVAAVLQSYRSGALGVMVSYDELGAIYGLNERTFRRWVRKLADTGILEVVKTWGPKPNTDQRGWRKHLYRPGPALAKEAGLGLLENAPELSETTQKLAGYHGRAARRRVRERSRGARDQAWKARDAQRNGEPKKCANDAPPAASLSPDTFANPTRPSGYGVSARPRSGSSVGAAPREEVSPRPASTAPSAPPDVDRSHPSAPPPTPPDPEAKRAWQDPGHRAASASLESALARLEEDADADRATARARARGRPDPRPSTCEACGGGGVTPDWGTCGPCGGSGSVLR